MLILAVVTIVSIGLMIGAEFAVSAFISPILWKLVEPARSQAVGLFAQKLGAVMPFWYSANFLLLIAETILLRHSAVFALLAFAVGIWAAVIVLTLIFLVPINNRLIRHDTGFTSDEAHRQHRHWDTMHRARVIALVVAFVLFILAARL
jgi:uncharacterized membrane protein